MATANYIHDLLYRYDCVILPGFGAFITQRQSARVLPEANQFLPPQKTVSFNSQLTKNDGLLANHLVEVEKISYKTAVENLSLFVEDLKNLLQENRSIELTNLGSFMLTEEDKLQFEPIHNNYLKEAFGLDACSTPEVNRERFRKHVDATSREVPVDFTSQRRSSRRSLKYAAVGLMAIGLSGFAGMNIYSYQVSEHNLAQQQKAASEIGNQIQQATFVIENPLPSVTLNISKQPGKYHVVAGAFRMERNADKRVEELKKEGFKARRIGANKYGLHQVVYSSYEGRLEALRALRAVKKTSNSGAWLLVQEL